MPGQEELKRLLKLKKALALCSMEFSKKSHSRQQNGDMKPSHSLEERNTHQALSAPAGSGNFGKVPRAMESQQLLSISQGLDQHVLPPGTGTALWATATTALSIRGTPS